MLGRARALPSNAVRTAMAFPVPPRSASDATRFTATTPHAAMRADAAAAGPGSSARPSGSRFQSPAGSGGAVPGGRRPPPSPLAGETPAQKVARLRAAHLAAKNAKVSQLDRIIDASRRLFDSAHRYTIVGLISFTAIATLVTAYTTVDMLRFNRKRKAEFIAAQAEMEADSLAAARLAFMRDEATPEQIALVEEAAAAERAAAARHSPSSSSDGFFKIPSALSPPAPVGTGAGAADGVVTAAAKKSWFGSALSRQEEGEAVGTSQSRLGYESLSEEDDSQGVRESDLVRAVEEHDSYLAAKASQAKAGVRAAVDRERANQQRGGPLDHLGLEASIADAASPKKSWYRFW